MTARFTHFLVFILLLTACKPQQEDISTNSRSPASALESMSSTWVQTSLFPLTLNYGSDFSSDEIEAVNNASTNWSDAVNNEVQFFVISPSQNANKENLALYQDNELGIYKSYNWPKELPSTALAITQIHGQKVGDSVDGGGYIRIEHADIILNFQNFSFVTDDTWGYDLQTVVLHEMGHFLGLYHEYSSALESVMYPSISRYNDNPIPKSIDIKNIQSKYGLNFDTGAVNNSLHRTGIQAGNEINSEPITFILELHGNGTEVLKLKKGDNYEIIDITHTDH